MLDDLIKQIDSLPTERRNVQGKLRYGSEVIDALPNPDQVLSAIETRLKEAMLWQLTPDGRLIVGDGCADPAHETRGKGYLRAKQAATAVAFQPNEGALRVLTLPYLSAPLVVSRDSITVGVADRAEVIKREKAQFLWLSRLARPHEYIAVNRGQFDHNGARQEPKGPKVWLLGGPDPDLAPLGWYDGRHKEVRVEEVSPHTQQDNRGARRVVEVYLNPLR